MIIYKSSQDIDKIRASALVLGKAHGEVARYVKPGVSTKSLDKIATEFIRDNKGIPSFLNYGGFPASLCISVNEVVVHGIPSLYELRDGDIVSIDCGVLLDGFHSDSAYTYPVGNVKPEVLDLLRVTKESLYIGIEFAKEGNRIGDLASAIQEYVETRGYSVVRELVGHGLGRSLHEKPEVPNYGKSGRGEKIKSGLVIAIEPMINLGKRYVVQEGDGWTIRTKDRMPSAHYEHTVAILPDRTEILTTFEFIEQTIKI